MIRCDVCGKPDPLYRPTCGVCKHWARWLIYKRELWIGGAPTELGPAQEIA